MDTTIFTTINPSDKSSLKWFISLERKLMKDYPHYVSKIGNDVARMLTRKAEMAKEMEFGLFVVSEAGEASFRNSMFPTAQIPGR